jgi:hypothetical protein
MDAETQLLKFLPVIGFILSIFIWVEICSHLSERSGWTELARRYRIVGKFSGNKWHFLDGKMRSEMNFYNSLTVGVNRQGLYLAPFIGFRPGSPPLFIPWHDIQMRVEDSASDWVDFHFRQAPDAWLKIKRDLVKQMEATVGSAWPGRAAE